MMETDREFYERVLRVVSEVCEVDSKYIFSDNTEKNVDARSMLIIYMYEKGYNDIELSILTGFTRQAINRIRIVYPDKLNRNCKLITRNNRIRFLLEKR